MLYIVNVSGSPNKTHPINAVSDGSDSGMVAIIAIVIIAILTGAASVVCVELFCFVWVSQKLVFADRVFGIQTVLASQHDFHELR